MSNATNLNGLSEAALIEHIVQQLPESVRAKARADLLDSNKVIQSEKPGIGPALARLADMRYAKGAAGREIAAAKHKENSARRASQVRVRIVLAPDLGTNDVRAVVLREPGDRGIPTLLLREEDATTGDLRIGLIAAAKAQVDFGIRPNREHRRTFRRMKGAGKAVPELEAHLAALRGAKRQPITGRGTLRTMEVFTALPKTAPGR